MRPTTTVNTAVNWRQLVKYVHFQKYALSKSEIRNKGVKQHTFVYLYYINYKSIELFTTCFLLKTDTLNSKLFIVSHGAGIPHFMEERLCIRVVTNHNINLSFPYRIFSLTSFNTVIVLIIFPLLPFEKMQLCYDLYEKLFETSICKTRRSSSFN